MEAAVWVGVLGPLQATVAADPVDLGSPMQRVLLAVLVAAEGRTVPAERLIDQLWDSPPARARHSLQQYVSRLRAALEPERQPGGASAIVLRDGSGYRLDPAAVTTDVGAFTRASTKARQQWQAGDVAAALRSWQEALGRWRGPALADLRQHPFAAAEARRLDEQRLGVIESVMDAELRLGGGAELVDELQRHVAEHPYRERLWGQLMTALHRAGRRVEALEAFQHVRTLLVDELGIDPGPELREIHQSILEDAPPTRSAGPPPVDTLAGRVAAAEATLRRGRLAEARAAFGPLLVDALEAEDADPSLAARAAIGLGGAWVNEIRLTDERRLALSRMRRALAALPTSAEDLRARLRVRLAAEAHYDGGSSEAVRQELETCQALEEPGRGRAVAEALSLAHHVLLSPEHAGTRLALADELVAEAGAAGETDLAVMGLCWRAVDQYLAGDPKAQRAHEELRLRAEAADLAHLRYITDVMDVMRLVRAGRLEEADAQALACFERGAEVGDVDAAGYYGGHLVSIRWLQGRGEEILPLVASMTAAPTVAPNDWIYVAVEAHLAGEAGDLDACAAALDRLRDAGLQQLPRWSTWLGTMVSVVEATRHLVDRDVAAQAHGLLAPYAHLPVMPSLAVTCLGSVERSLGVAAWVMGAVDAAVEHLRRAVAANRRLGNRPMTAMARADLAEVLTARAETGDLEEAQAALREADAAARRMGMAARAERWLSRG